MRAMPIHRFVREFAIARLYDTFAIMIPNPIELPAFVEAPELLNAVIETVRFSRSKIDFDAKLGVYRFHDLLPVGMVFPFHFGFIPSTLGEDGDPLDIVVVTEATLATGCVVSARLVGVIEAEQMEPRKAAERNDRLIAVADGDHSQKHIREFENFQPGLVDELERFFSVYANFKGREWKPVRRGNSKKARALVEQGMRAYRDKPKQS
jgi:inorganic pyrophosphatase